MIKKTQEKKTKNGCYLAPGFVVMEIHEGAPDELLIAGAASATAIAVAIFVIALAAREPVLPGIDERPREGRAEVDVIRAARPLETVGRRPPDAPIAAAVVQLAGRARARQRMRNAGRRYGVHESSFTCPFDSIQFSFIIIIIIMIIIIILSSMI